MGKARVVKSSEPRTTTVPCTKVQFEDRAAAKRGLAKVQSYPRRSRTEQRPKAVYECPRCGYWHLTKQDKKKGSE